MKIPLRKSLSLALLLLLLLTACQQTTPPAKPLDPAQARIIFTRKSNMLGALVPHYIFDRGTPITPDAVLTDKHPLKPNAETILNSDIVLGSDVINSTPNHPPLNAHYIGEAHNGQTLIYDRPPGTLQITAVTQDGDEALSDPFTLQPNKTYHITYNYGQPFSPKIFTLTQSP